MKLFLFGWAEINLWQFEPQLKLIEKIIQDINPKQVLHIPFARTIASEKEWSDGRFERNIDIKWAEYLNAKDKSDIDKADSPLIVISGGGENVNLLNKIQDNPKLLKLIENSDYIIWESAWTKVLCAYFREKWSEPNSNIARGLDIIKDTIIEPHYSERNRQDALVQGMEKTWARYGIGIDCATAIVFEVWKFPGEWSKIGDGIVDIKVL